MSSDELQKLMVDKLKAAKRLMSAEEWVLAAYVLGYALECALKAAASKTLRLESYPPKKKDGTIASGFISHEFEQLIIVSGLRPEFQIGGDAESIDNWGAFTSLYPDNWPIMRYQLIKDQERVFNAETVNRLYGNLYDNDASIIKTIRKKQKW